MRLVANKTLTLEDYLKAFPFPIVRPKQRQVIQEICNAFNSGYRIIVLEAPTGFGKSPVAMCVARTLGSSYICSATKELQTQYVNDFQYLRSVKGMENFTCLVREDFASNHNYRCGQCAELSDYDECRHKSVNYGPCRAGQIGYAHIKSDCTKCQDKFAESKFHNGCRYRTYTEDYCVKNRNTSDEAVFIEDLRVDEFQEWFKSTQLINMAGETGYSWMHLNNLKNCRKTQENQFRPCPYYDQLNIGLVASHSIFNYANFLIFLRMKNGEFLPEKELLILDEGHQIENQVVEHVGISLTKRSLQKYIPTYILENTNLDYSSGMEEWLQFLRDLQQLLETSILTMKTEELEIDARNELKRLELVIDQITLKPESWIVSNIVREGDKGQGKWKQHFLQSADSKVGTNRDIWFPHDAVKANRIIKVEFKPLDVSEYCRQIFDKCSRTLIMSATILDIESFCRSVGIGLNSVKLVRTGSDFPIKNRPIYYMNTAYLNFKSLDSETTQRKIAEAVDRIMSLHKDEKGIIHCTSYTQVRFIEKYISSNNMKRLIDTSPETPREEIVTKYITSTMPTVLISPSLHTGLDLKDERSRFQILVKLPYPNKGDKWINAKMKADPGWYNWQTTLTLVQAYGRSVRSKDDWAETYVLDSAFEDFVRKNKLPGWFMEAIES